MTTRKKSFLGDRRKMSKKRKALKCQMPDCPATGKRSFATREAALFFARTFRPSAFTVALCVVCGI